MLRNQQKLLHCRVTQSVTYEKPRSPLVGHALRDAATQIMELDSWPRHAERDRLMIKQKLRRIQQHPEHIAQRLALVPGGAAAVDVARELLALLGGRLTRQRGEEDRFHFLVRVQKRRIGDGREDLAFVQTRLVRDELAVHHHERLQDRRLRLGRAGAVAAVAALVHVDVQERLDAALLVRLADIKELHRDDSRHAVQA